MIIAMTNKNTPTTGGGSLCIFLAFTLLYFVAPSVTGWMLRPLIILVLVLQVCKHTLFFLAIDIFTRTHDEISFVKTGSGQTQGKFKRKHTMHLHLFFCDESLCRRVGLLQRQSPRRQS